MTDKTEKPVSDGCTNSPNGGFNHCCIEHDAYYHDGSLSRFKADNKLFTCILKEGDGNVIRKVWHFGVASVYWVAVRIFGASRYNENKTGE